MLWYHQCRMFQVLVKIIYTHIQYNVGQTITVRVLDSFVLWLTDSAQR